MFRCKVLGIGILENGLCLTQVESFCVFVGLMGLEGQNQM
jgi:hypothetical protein